MKKYIFLPLLVISFNALSSNTCQVISGAKIIAQDSKNTYLGKLNNSFSSDSIFNEYGTYGSEYSSLSVFNNYGDFGSEYNSYSATNPYSSKPPMIIKNQNIIGYLSANKTLEGAVTPRLLKALCADEL